LELAGDVPGRIAGGQAPPLLCVIGLSIWRHEGIAIHFQPVALPNELIQADDGTAVDGNLMNHQELGLVTV
jgi:hypothetical protein